MTATSRSLLSVLCAEVLAAWQRGWQPAEMVRVIRKQTTVRHAAVVVDAIAAQMREYAPATVDDRWRAQLAELDAVVGWTDDDRILEWWSLREGLAAGQMAAIADVAHAHLMRLPHLPKVGPLPGEHRPGRTSGPDAAQRGERPTVERPADTRMLEKVRALLAKAESTQFPEEAEAYTAKAQELMARHSIDEALLSARTGAPSGPDLRRIAVDNPYEAPKTLLLQAVAAANRCRCVWMKEYGFATVLGFPTDLDAVELLFTSLLVQAVRAMTMHEATSASFRRAFLTAYAVRIGQRLDEATQRAEAAQRAEEGAGSDLLPVLSRRAEEVEQQFRDVFPKVRRHSVNVSNGHGWAEGRAAADRADLHGRAAVRAHSPAGRA